jgi:hypothetical protein
MVTMSACVFVERPQAKTSTGTLVAPAKPGALPVRPPLYQGFDHESLATLVNS